MEYTIVQQTDIETVVVEASGLINSTVAAKMIFPDCSHDIIFG